MPGQSSIVTSFPPAIPVTGFFNFHKITIDGQPGLEKPAIFLYGKGMAATY